MSRSLAIVGILAMLGGAGSQSAMGQTDGTQTSEGLVVNNHMTDAERDRLMQEAMAKARRQLEKKKAEEATALESAAEKEKETQAEQKAREEELAKQLAEQEKARQTETVKMELEPLKPETAKKDLDKEPKVTEAEKKSETKKAETAKAEPKKTEEPKKSEESKKTVAETKKLDSSSKSDSSSGKSEKKVAASDKAPEKAPERSRDGSPSDYDKAEEIERAVIETVSTRDPGSGLTVKASMPRGSVARSSSEASDSSRGGGSTNLSGRVVGMMRSSHDKPRILVQGQDGRMVQVVLENGAEVPTPGSEVSVNGREISGEGSRRVLSAHSVNIKSGRSLKAPATIAAAPAPPVPAPIGPLPGLPPPPPIGIVGPPPIPMGPMPMLPPPPPF